MQIAEGSVILKVQVENISALNALWCLYRDGTLKGEELISEAQGDFSFFWS